ncbi:ABC transporter substrate-binding protein [Desulfosporosinus sp. PR]|uniref:ABC transporter substrate-binding protein n=1 Tax=Candidatus Desulfosporosinus nitrosoreducens TaxID=3401928 RepID=UPI0027F26AAE|nr:ABC transporter substrate-binding protein [Desulfosporosinus sp. PR]MDQ7094557.1 ABC transporter substrate-binding protein [Desulfosporosinus sp. PR]
MYKKNFKRFYVLVTALLILMVTAAGCGTKQAAPEAASVPTTVTVTDMAGRTVTVPTNIKKVITFNAVPPLNSLIMAFGKGDTIINGIPASMVKMPQTKYQTILAPQIAKGPDLGSTPNVETIMALTPDVVITSEQSTAQALQSSKIPVIYLKSSTSKDDIEKAMTILGKVFGNPDRAKEYNQYYEDKLAALNKTVATIPADQRPKVLNMWASNMAGFNSAWWIDPAGGVDAFDGQGMNGGYGGVTVRYQISYEQILQWNPDIIIVRDAKDIPSLESNPQLANVKAIKNKKIYVTPAGTFTWNGAVETPLLSEWAATKFYPDLFKQADLVNDVKGFYKEFLNYQLTDKEAEEMLNGLQ